jgi:hypothetical protein
LLPTSANTQLETTGIRYEVGRQGGSGRCRTGAQSPGIPFEPFPAVPTTRGTTSYPGDRSGRRCCSHELSSNPVTPPAAVCRPVGVVSRRRGSSSGRGGCSDGLSSGQVKWFWDGVWGPPETMRTAPTTQTRTLRRLGDAVARSCGGWRGTVLGRWSERWVNSTAPRVTGCHTRRTPLLQTAFVVVAAAVVAVAWAAWKRPPVVAGRVPPPH